jgi:phospholipid-binding lipoprotein MlaA
MLPLLGPSNVRDTAGLIGDSASSIPPWFVSWWILVPPRAAEAINARALLLQQIDEAKRAAFDYYVFVRDAYLQSRNALMNDRAPGTGGGDTDDLYHPDVAPPGAVVPPYGGSQS